MANFKISKIRYTWKNLWVASTSFVKDDIVQYGGKSYVCLISHTSTTSFATDLAASNWVLMFDGSVWKSTWTASTFYNPGDLVKYGATIYRCLIAHTSATNISPTYLGLETDQAKWEIVARTEDWKSVWTISTKYKVNDVVRYGATVYRCNTAHISAATTVIGLENDQAKWDTVFQQADYKGVWTISTRYKVNDVARIDGSLWRCTIGHVSTATATSLPSDLTAYWAIYLDGLEFTYANWSNVSTYKQGDIVTYGGYSYRALQPSIAQTPSTATSYWEIVTTNYRFLGDWNSGVNYLVGDTIRVNGYVYTCILDNTNQVPPNATYWTAIVPGRYWRNQWANGSTYRLGDLVTFKATSYECKLAHTATLGLRPDTDVAGSGTYWMIFIEGNTANVLTTQGDIVWYNSGAKDRLAIGTDGQVLKVSGSNLTWTSFGIVTKIYYVSTTGTDSPGLGTTINAPWRTIRYACQNVTGPATIFIKNGTYDEQLPISVPANVALVGDEHRSVTVQPAAGYENQNMFYVRNGSTIEHMTMQGFSGTLGSANAYGTRRPTAPVYVSLDPGSGPSDSSVWITSKSPYIRYCSTFGTACVGVKVDGTLHNGGNKSIVINDFTQILSDGIGLWINGLGRAEAVSVFTYYNYIGYLTENGGKLRAIGGNNSYGSYGCVSEGVDTTETPITALVNNRSGQATIGAISKDDTRILNLEFTNTGTNYSDNPTITIVGTGTNQLVDYYNKRTAGVSEFRITDPTNTGFPGGTSYLNVTGFAQTGTSNGTITLAATDTNLQSNYIGMRVVITAGDGAGQYGIVNSYNSTTKVATIFTESTGVQGWDHWVDGTTIVALDSTSQYSIEPRVIASAVTYSSSSQNLPVSANWSSVSYGSGRFVTVDGAGNIAAYSADGVTWSATSFRTLGIQTSVAWSGTYFVSVGITGTAAVNSTTGTSWSNITLPALGGTTYSKIIPGSQGVVALITSGATRTNLLNPNFGSITNNGTAQSVSAVTGVINPAGTTTQVWKLIEDTSSGNHRWQNNTTTGTNTYYTFSIFAKAVERTQLALGLTNGAGSEVYYIFDLSAGTVGSANTSGADWTAPSAKIYPVGKDGWYRISVTGFKNIVNSNVYTEIYTVSSGSISYAGNGLSGLYLWGSQLEASAALTSFINSTVSGAGIADLSISADGVTWNALGSPPTATSAPRAFAYGMGMYVYIQNTTTNTVYYSTNGILWSSSTLPVSSTWCLAFGDSKFVAIPSGSSTGYYSLDGISWTAMTLPSSQPWNVVNFGQGVWYIAAAGTSTGATSLNGRQWTSRTLPAAASWSDGIFGNPSSPGIEIMVSAGSSISAKINYGATAVVRPTIISGSIRSFRIIDPGSGYAAGPTLTITDPNVSSAVSYTARLGDNVLSQPTWARRGTGWILATSATVTDSSGYADSFQTGYYVVVNNLSAIPTVGSNITFTGNTVAYKLLALSNVTGSIGNYSARLQLDTSMSTYRSPSHASSLAIRINYSQCRLTGHDFLSIGTGNITTTNYPNTPTQSALSTLQAVEGGGGRVFYVSTDQDGNFLCGNLFGVQQATGVVTLSASLFNLSGLSQLSLGAIIVGSTSAIINTISTDGTLSANSDNVISTQRAIASYISSRIGGGGANTSVSAITAGNISIQSDTISNILSSPIVVNNKLYVGPGGVSGSWAGITYFMTR